MLPLEPDNDHERRFGGLDRLYGDGTRTLLHSSHIAVIGVGGVGSWAVEALARSGIGNITLIDFDHVAVSNINRQIQALNSTLGEAKTTVLEARIQDINSACCVTVIDDFLTKENIPELIPAGKFDAVIDACDQAHVKAALIAYSLRNNIWLTVCGAAGGKRNPLNLRQSDLGKTIQDLLLSRIKKMLRKQFRTLPRRNGKFNVPCVYVAERTKKSDGCSTGDLSCAGYGSAVTVTAPMGFSAAALCINHIVANQSS
jgi:tRNA A37 threonylcarbamoyladenosine dehydratase